MCMELKMICFQTKLSLNPTPPELTPTDLLEYLLFGLQEIKTKQEVLNERWNILACMVQVSQVIQASIHVSNSRLCAPVLPSVFPAYILLGTCHWNPYECLWTQTKEFLSHRWVNVSSVGPDWHGVGQLTTLDAVIQFFEKTQMATGGILFPSVARERENWLKAWKTSYGS